MKENDCVNAIMEYLNYKNIFVFRVNNTPIYDPRGGRFRKKGKWERYGVSDILGIYKGKFLAIEVKRPNGVLSDYQKKFIKDVNDRGGIAFKAVTVDDVIKELDKI